MVFVLKHAGGVVIGNVFRLGPEIREQHLSLTPAPLVEQRKCKKSHVSAKRCNFNYTGSRRAYQ